MDENPETDFYSRPFCLYECEEAVSGNTRAAGAGCGAVRTIGYLYGFWYSGHR